MHNYQQLKDYMYTSDPFGFQSSSSLVPNRVHLLIASKAPGRLAILVEYWIIYQEVMGM